MNEKEIIEATAGETPVTIDNTGATIVPDTSSGESIPAQEQPSLINENETALDIPPVTPSPPDQPKQPEPLKKPPGRDYWTEADYLKADWTQTNAVLAKQFGCSRQNISIRRRKLFPGKTKPTPGGIRFDGNVNEDDDDDQPSFDDLDPKSTAPTADAALMAAAVDYRKTSELLFDLSTNSLSMFLGAEWQPRQPLDPAQPSEREVMVKGIESYIRTKNIPDIPPGYMLAFLVVMYSAPRMQQPNTRGKLKLAYQWVKSKAGGLFTLFKRKKPIHGAN